MLIEIKTSLRDGGNKKKTLRTMGQKKIPPGEPNSMAEKQRAKVETWGTGVKNQKRPHQTQWGLKLGLNGKSERAKNTKSTIWNNDEDRV